MHGKLVQKIHRKLSLHAEILPPLQEGNLFTKTSSHKNELSALFGDPKGVDCCNSYQQKHNKSLLFIVTSCIMSFMMRSRRLT